MHIHLLYTQVRAKDYVTKARNGARAYTCYIGDSRQEPYECGLMWRYATIERGYRYLRDPLSSVGHAVFDAIIRPKHHVHVLGKNSSRPRKPN